MKFRYYPILIIALVMTMTEVYTMKEQELTQEEKMEHMLREYLQPMAFRHIEQSLFPIVKEFVKTGLLDKPMYDEKGNTQLHIAVLSNDPAKVDLIVGVNPELATIKNKAGQIPLDLALDKKANEEIVQKLIEAQVP
jgi:hypothetical protein